MSAPSRPPRVEILGVPVSAITLQDAVMTIDAWIRSRRRHYVCVTGVHGIMECRRDAALREIHASAGMVTPDGMPLVWMAHRLGRPRVRRVYGPDLMREISRISPALGYRHYYFGGGPGLADKLSETLRAAHPGLVVAGTFSPPFGAVTAEEDEAIVRAINASRPDIVWVGLSTPKQERWMSAHRDRIEAPVLIGVGAAFDFLAGTKRQAPRWMQRNGLEWAFRLGTEPRRLWRRYASMIPRFVALATAQLIRRDRTVGRAENTV
ncbi:MAG: glycosyltransferase [Methylobacterium sp.]|jgi:N-acetylglucosaminyldiphosphoundecaprenol N-acetyl-beta-D-mannosaminyltransferase|uniref:WecB/TagA/CpsF family glycosyltransferase n=2 Tax=Methylobacterium TaxID=407 RepID=UPI0011C7BDB9|nr:MULTISPECIES: WecB/TagA/CpsF family glycosyltransferase [unclassified Methylobacterium]MCJ2041934.1 WecB/TagA/CpsF family glycosyltransferase [Methylobacterium sp. J-059]RZK90553.1 MAG: glycosyltransferase [Methylobacterium sp.]TXN71598.1 WecB/TagA/CpsF family glycosyltransferase [Methylobacterium sp. WL6]